MDAEIRFSASPPASLAHMKTSTLARNGVTTEVVALLEGKQRVAEDVFGWNRRAIEVGIHEYQTGITCINDIAIRVKPKTEDKHPKLLAEIHSIMEPHSESESSLRTTLLYTNMTAKTVHEALVQKGWSPESLPSVRTISNLLHRQDYRLRTVAKTKVQKNR